jgi:hypothetical protein
MGTAAATRWTNRRRVNGILAPCPRSKQSTMSASLNVPPVPVLTRSRCRTYLKKRRYTSVWLLTIQDIAEVPWRQTGYRLRDLSPVGRLLTTWAVSKLSSAQSTKALLRQYRQVGCSVLSSEGRDVGMLPAFAAERCKVDSVACNSSGARRGSGVDMPDALSGIKGIITEWYRPKRRVARAASPQRVVKWIGKPPQLRNAGQQ